MKIPENDKQLIALSNMSLGQKAVIIAFDAREGESIQDMGLIRGEQLEVVRYPSQGEPIEVKIRGYFVSLGRKEADRIKVKLL